MVSLSTVRRVLALDLRLSPQEIENCLAGLAGEASEPHLIPLPVALRIIAEVEAGALRPSAAA